MKCIATIKLFLFFFYVRIAAFYTFTSGGGGEWNKRKQ